MAVKLDIFLLIHTILLGTEFLLCGFCDTPEAISLDKFVRFEYT